MGGHPPTPCKKTKWTCSEQNLINRFVKKYSTNFTKSEWLKNNFKWLEIIIDSLQFQKCKNVRRTHIWERRDLKVWWEFYWDGFIEAGENGHYHFHHHHHHHLHHHHHYPHHHHRHHEFYRDGFIEAGENGHYIGNVEHSLVLGKFHIRIGTTASSSDKCWLGKFHLTGEKPGHEVRGRQRPQLQHSRREGELEWSFDSIIQQNILIKGVLQSSFNSICQRFSNSLIIMNNK